MQYVVPPFKLGATLDGTDDNGNKINEDKVGMIFEAPANQFDVSGIRGQKKRRSGRQLRVVALRNESGMTLYGKRLASLTTSPETGYPILGAVDGYATSLAQKNVVVIDEFIDTIGVPDNDIFWGVLKGPVTVLSAAAGAAFNGDIAVGAQLVAATAAGSTTSVAGRISNTTGTALSMALNLVGVALTAKTTGETGEAVLIDARLNV
jgi:hypothetical protein